VLGLPPGVVRDVILRHVVIDGPEDPWVVFAPAEPDPARRQKADDDHWPAPHLQRVRAAYPGWPRDIIDLALRRWPDDLIAMTSDLVCGVWGGVEEGFASAAGFMGELIDCLEPDWWADVWAEGMTRVHGNLADRATQMPARDFRPHPDHDLVRRRMLREAERADLLHRLARRLLADDLGDLPKLILDCPADEWLAAGQLLCVLFKRRLPGVTERLEARLFRSDGLFEFLAAMVADEDGELETGVGLLYDMVTGSEGGARRFVDTLAARKGYDLPSSLRRALVERLSVGLGAVVEVVDTADPSLGMEVLRVSRRWRGELDAFRWYRSVDRRDSEARAERHARGFRPTARGNNPGV
jgi:hypothetical protein